MDCQHISIHEASSANLPAVAALLEGAALGTNDLLAPAPCYCAAWRCTAAHAGCARAYLFSTGTGSYWLRQGFREVPVPELVAALPQAPQVSHYHAQGWLPTEVAWRRDLA